MMVSNADGDDSGQAAGRLNRQLRLLRIVKLNRLLRLSKLSNNLKQVERHVKLNPSAMRLLSLCFLMLGFCHWLGCLWWLVSDMELTGACVSAVDYEAEIE